MSLRTPQHRLMAMAGSLLLVGLLAGQEILRDFVLCLGSDGHVALEAATGPGGTCKTLSNREPDRELFLLCSSSNQNLGHHCGPCDDFILADSRPDFWEPSLRVTFSRTSLEGGLLAVVALATVSHRLIDTLAPYHHQAPPSSDLKALRSTILLI